MSPSDETGDTTSGESTSGESTSGDTTSGDTTSGESTSGESTSGDTTSGDTTAASPAADRPAADTAPVAPSGPAGSEAAAAAVATPATGEPAVAAPGDAAAAATAAATAAGAAAQAAADAATAEAQELARLRAEVEQLRASTPPPARKRRPFRMALAIVLLILGALSAITANLSTWVRSTVLDSETFVATVAPLPRDPAISTALANYAVDELFAQVNVEQRVRDALPVEISWATGPLVSSVEDFAKRMAATVIASDQFAAIWEGATRLASEQANSLLRGDGGIVSTTSSGEVQLRLGALAQEALNQLGDVGSSLFGNVNIPSDLGTITVFRSEQIAQARTAVEWLDRGATWAMLLAVVCLGGAIAAWPDRRRGVIAVGVAVALAMGLTLAAVQIGLGIGLDQIADPGNKAAAQAAADIVLARFLEQTRTLLWLGVGAAVIAIVVGPAVWAVAARNGVRRASLAVWNALFTHDRKVALGRFARTYEAPLITATAVVALLLLVLLPGISWTRLVVLAVLAVLVSLAIWGMSTFWGRLSPQEEGAMGFGRLADAATSVGRKAAGAAKDAVGGQHEGLAGWIDTLGTVVAHRRDVTRLIVVAVALVVLLLVGLTVTNLLVIAVLAGAVLWGLETLGNRHVAKTGGEPGAGPSATPPPPLPGTTSTS